MNYSLYSVIYILIYLSLRTQSQLMYLKANTTGANELLNDENEPLDNYIDTSTENSNIGSKKFPFMVSIQRNDGGKYTHLCGGTILDKQFVLTAAHCTLKPRQLLAKELTVVGGSQTLFDKNAKRFKVKAMKKHPQFIPLKGNDILLLQVEPEIQFDNIQFGTIDFRNTTRKRGGLNGYLLGWGRTQINKPKDLEVLPVHTITDKECFLDYRFKYLTNSEVCAITSKGPRGACDGDSGGPIVDESVTSIYGLLSYGRQACEVGKPYAYTRISIYTKWIDQEMKNMLKLSAKTVK